MTVNPHCGKSLHGGQVILVGVHSYHEWIGQQTEDDKAADSHDGAHPEDLAVCPFELKYR